MNEGTDATDSVKWHTILEEGTIFTVWKDKYEFNEKFFQDAIANQFVLGETQPFLDRDHDRGEALGWSEGIRTDRGNFQCRWRMTKEGERLLSEEGYHYFSAHFDTVPDPKTGDLVFPVFVGAALTNAPLNKTLPKITLSEASLAKGYKKGYIKDDLCHNDTKGENVNNEELKAGIDALSPKERVTLLSEVGFIPAPEAEEKAIALSEALGSAKAELNTARERIAVFEKDLRSSLLDSAIEEGKIKMSERDRWDKLLVSNFGDYKDVLDSMVSAYKLNETLGTGAEDPEDPSIHANQLANITEKEAKI